MTIAEKIADGKLRPPSNVEDAIAEVLAAAAHAHAGIVETHELAVDGKVPAHRPEEAEFASKNVRDEHLRDSTYAYRFEDFDDGSRLAVYVTRHGEEAQLKPFPHGRERDWHPVRNP